MFQTVTSADLRDKIKAAMGKWAGMPEDSKFDSGISASMSVANGGRGQQNNVQGNYNTMNKA